jgi:sulfite oxidase
MGPNSWVSRRGFLQSVSAAAVAGAFGRQRIVWGQEPDLIVRTPDPFNAEPTLRDLVADRITPSKFFYIRNHGPSWRADPNGFKLRIEGLVQKPEELSLDEIKQRFPRQTVEATLTCAGNRRDEMSAIKPVSGVQWSAGAIGHARWGGASLAEVLRAAEIRENARHVWFEGLDPIKEKDGSVAPFGGSIPLEKALAGEFPALLAYAMNDEPLTANHGFPLRTI